MSLLERTASRSRVHFADLQSLAAAPRIHREGIHWTGGLQGEGLEIELTFENPSDSSSQLTTARVGIAAFGAFLPWKPLARVLVPPIPPGGRTVVTATTGGEEEPPHTARRTIRLLAAQADGAPGNRRLVDLLVGRFRPLESRDVHFAGNINVHVNRRSPVERHMRRSVGLRPGKANVAFFCLGDGHRDTYTIDVGKAEPGWEVTLHGYELGVPTELATATLTALIRAPDKATSGDITLLVHRHSTRQTAHVEFQLETAAQAKCYFF